ncbi:carboxylesterase [Marivirga lumbricoides]|uniref:Carboxylic ester hydrolase n=1 Tax=Marivirga lumbricoides TaxID=1046115 RepID=A0A2T4DUE3_9BACT|nr:carboxylesterase [Marivirga lumbricoides]
MKNLLVIVIILSMHSNSYAQSNTVTTPAGKIHLFEDNGVMRATTIPYARAGRFEKPVPIEKYDSPLNAYKPAPACPQTEKPLFSMMFGIEPLDMQEQSEDCLNLSVTRPNNDLDKLPVMIWIHGGSYISGAGDAVIFDPKPLVKEQDVIVVSVTYRLGLLGFLGGYNNIPANLGYLDILESIKWVNNNISAFGGDPKNITLFGQSAGGEAIAQMMLIEESKGLFQNVIIQSAPLGLIFERGDMINDMVKVAREIPAQAEIDTILKRQEEVLAAAKEYGLKAGMPFGNQYGVYPFPEESQVQAIWKERASEVNILIGYTQEETSFFIPHMPALRKYTEFPIIGGLLNKILISSTSKKVYKKAANEFAKNCAVEGNNVYRYEITWGSDTNGYGATHTIDLPLLFGDSALWKDAKLVEGISAEEISRSQKEVRALWARFAATGTIEQKGAIRDVLKYKKI